MPDAQLSVPNDYAFCDLELSAGKTKAAVASISAEVVVVAVSAPLKKNDYIDVVLQLKDGGTHNLFTQVVASDGSQARLRWLHFDPSEQARLGRIIEKWGAKHKLGSATNDQSAVAADAPKQDNSKSRRVVRPRRGAVMPNAGADTAPSGKSSTKRRGAVLPNSDTEPLSPAAAMAAEAGEAPDLRKARKGVVRPTSAESTEASSTEEAPLAPPPVDDEDDLGLDLELDLDADDPSPAAAAVKEHPPKSEPPVQEAPEPVKKEPAPVAKAPPAAAKPAAPEQAKPAPQSAAKPSAKSAAAESPQNQKTSRTTKARKHRVAVRGEDGTLDVAASIRAQTRTMSSEELAKKQDKVRVLNMRVIRDLIASSVAEAIGRLGADLEESERKRLLAEAEEEFQERMKDFQAEKMGLEERAQQLQAQLDRAEQMLKKEKGREVDANQFTMSAASVEDLEKALHRVVDAAKRNGLTDGLAKEIDELVANSLDSERQKRADQEEAAKNQAIQLLEKKVKRLATSLEDAEKERDYNQRKVAALEASGGGAIAGQSVFGMGEDDPDKERKLDLLKGIFRENQEMRQAIAGTGIKIQGRKRKKKPAPEVASEGEGASEDAAAATEDVAAPVVANEASPGVDASAAAEDSAVPQDDVDPDDLPWEPGQSFSSEPEMDDGDSPIKKMTDFKSFGPPPLQSSGSDDGDAAATEDEAISTAEDVDPDDLPWEPGQSFSKEPDLGDEDDASPVKKMTDFKSFGPPPLQRK